MNDAESEPRSASNQTYVSESVARKKKRVTDATCLRDMVIIQEYLARDIKMGDEVTATLNSASRLMQSISSLVDEEKKYLEKKEKREEEKLEVKRREVEEEEEELELKKKELGIATGGGNSQKSSDCNTQKAGDDTPSVPSPSPASSGNVASV